MVEALVLINTQFESSQDQTLEDLKEIKLVNTVYTTVHGVYDFVVRVKTETANELKNKVLESIQKIDAVVSMTTLVMAKKAF